MIFKNILKKRKLYFIIGLIITVTVIVSLSCFLENKHLESLDLKNAPQELIDCKILIRNSANLSNSDRTKYMEAIKEAMSILPPSVQDDVISFNRDSLLTIEFTESSDYWGKYSCSENRIKISTYCNEKVEIIYALLHEMGHAYSLHSFGGWTFLCFNHIYIPPSYREILDKEYPPSFFACYGYKNEGGYYPLEGHRKWEEDFAESFAYYVLIPGFLKENCPLRYDWLKNNVFDGIEYKTYPEPIPESITDCLYFVK